VKALLAIAFAMPLAADLLDRFIAWARKRWQVTVPEYCHFPEFRLFLWAHIKCDNPAYDYELFVLKLPSWEWTRAEYDYRNRREWCWHQRHLYRRSRRLSCDAGIEAPSWGVELIPDA
jgi:hypothetical protein